VTDGINAATAMKQTNRTLTAMLGTIAVLLGLIALELYLGRAPKVYADTGRFDYVHVLGTSFIYNGSPGVLLLDKRNGNVWFIPRGQDMKQSWFKDPVFVIRVPLEKLDEQPR
jgi:hypothetical protein